MTGSVLLRQLAQNGANDLPHGGLGHDRADYDPLLPVLGLLPAGEVHKTVLHHDVARRHESDGHAFNLDQFGIPHVCATHQNNAASTTCAALVRESAIFDIGGDVA